MTLGREAKRPSIFLRKRKNFDFLKLCYIFTKNKTHII